MTAAQHHDHTTPKRLPSLPTEIWHRILISSLPPVGFHLAKERRSFLARCNLVSKLWNSWLQRELYRDIVISDPTTSRKLIETVKNAKEQVDEGDDKLSKMVETLRIGSEYDDTGEDQDGRAFEVSSLLRCFPSVDALFLGRLHQPIDFVKLLRNTQLVDLHIWGCEFDSACLPTDEDAHRYHDDKPEQRREIIKSRLRHVTIRDSVIANVSFLMELIVLFRHFQTDAFHCDCASNVQPHQPVTSLACAEPLTKALSNPIIFFSTPSQHISKSLPFLPPSVRILRVTSTGQFFGSDRLSPYLSVNRKTRFPNLETLILPTRLQMSASFEELRELCREEGIEIEWERDEDSPTMWDRPFWRVVDRVDEMMGREQREEAIMKEGAVISSKKLDRRCRRRKL